MICILAVLLGVAVGWCCGHRTARVIRIPIGATALDDENAFTTDERNRFNQLTDGLDVIEPYCDGFPDTCPHPITVPPAPPHHGGGIRCGCYDSPKEHSDV